MSKRRSFLDRVKDSLSNVRKAARTTSSALKWFREFVLANLRRGGPPPPTDELIGRLYFFSYDPKHKKTLPYYDEFPLAFIMDVREDSFLSLNLHYLDPALRAQLMDVLIRIRDRAGDKKRYTLVSYSVLKAAARHELFAPCVKMHLYSHIRSRLVKVDDEWWHPATLLPVHRFKKASAREVWRDSRRRASK